jgi:P4 family phage/plasmid primase-like protien
MSSKNDKINIIDDNEHNNNDDSEIDALDAMSDVDDDDVIIINNNNVHNVTKYNNKKALNNYVNLADFISKHKCDYGDKTYTHTWWDNTKNIIFKVESGEYEEYLNVYNNELKFKYGKVHVMEKPLDFGPLCLDYDVKLSDGIRCFEKINITHVIQSINKIIKKYYNLSEEQEELVCYILVKNKPYYDEKKQLYSDGFHVQYPNLILDVKDRFLIYEESKNEIVDKGYFDELFKVLIKHNLETETNKKYEITDDNDIIDEDHQIVSNGTTKRILDEIISELFDSSVIKRNSWFLYGSGKKRSNDVYFYKVMHIFDPEINEYDEIPDKEELTKILAIRRENLSPIKSKSNLNLEKKYIFITSKFMKTLLKKPDVKSLFKKNTDIDMGMGMGMDMDVDANMDVVMDANRNTNTDRNAQFEVQEINNKNKYCKDSKDSKDSKESKESKDSNDILSMARKLIKLLNKKRAGPYNEWITVGWALYNISPTLLPDFIHFSKQDNKKYETGCCEKIWDESSRRMTDGGYTIASLYMWAKEDNPEEYIKLIRANVNKLLEEANTKTDYDVAKVIHEMYKYEFKCTAITGNIWWQFENHRWKKIDNAYTLGIKLSEDVAREFAELSASYMKESILSSGHKADILVKKSTDINKLILDLKRTPFKDKIIRECAPLFYDSKFEEKLDDNPHLIGFDNGVYDLRTGLFRNGCPDDYLSFTCGYDFESNYNANSPNIVAIEKFLCSIHPDDDLRKYVLCFVASLLEGGNSDQKFFFWTGSGSNGKGTLVELIDNTLGDYYGTLPVSLLTVKRKGSSSATPEMADKKGKRVLVMQEPEHDDEINVGHMKELTGQDKIMARALYSQPVYYIPQFVPILPCNTLPKISSGAYDGGVRRRIRVVEFSQKFVDEPTKPNEHPKDPLLRNQLKTWHKPFMWLLLNTYYPLYKKYGIEKLEPECVKMSTQKYEKDSNSYYEFKEEFICDDPNERLARDDIWRLFKEWYTNNYNDRKLPASKELYKYFEDSGYEKRGSKFCGIAFKERIDDNNVALN